MRRQRNISAVFALKAKMLLEERISLDMLPKAEIIGPKPL